MSSTDLTAPTADGFAAAYRDATGTLDRWHAALARREHLLWTAVLLGLLADGGTTLYGLQVGLSEGNPLVASVLGESGVAGFFLVKALAVGVGVGLRVVDARYRVVAPLGLALPWLLAAGVNALLLAATL